MKKNQQPSQQETRIQGVVTDGRLVPSKDGRYVTIYFADGSKIREHKNRLLSLLGAPFTPEAPKTTATDASQPLTTGYIAKTRMLLTKDKMYVTIFFPGGRFVRHVNYVKSVLGLDFEPVTKTKAS